MKLFNSVPDIFAGINLEVWSSGISRVDFCPGVSHEQEHERSGRACMAGSRGCLRSWTRHTRRFVSQCRLISPSLHNHFEYCNSDEVDSLVTSVVQVHYLWYKSAFENRLSANLLSEGQNETR